MQLSIAAVNIKLDESPANFLNVSRQFLEQNTLFLNLIRLLPVQIVVESVPICLWIKSFSKYSMISLHCKQIEFNVSLHGQSIHISNVSFSFAQLNLARYSTNIAFDILIRVRLHWYSCQQLNSLRSFNNC